MNHKVVISTIGKLIQLEGIFLLLPAVIGAFMSEREFFILAIIAVASIAVGFLLQLVKPKEGSRLRAKEGFVITALAWLVFSVVGALQEPASLQMLRLCQNVSFFGEALRTGSAVWVFLYSCLHL